MHEHKQNSGHQAQNVSGESSDANTVNQGLLKNLAARDELRIEWLDDENLTVAVERNPKQSLVLVENDAGVPVVAAVDRGDVTLAEAIEVARDFGHAIDRLSRSPFASDGGEPA